MNTSTVASRAEKLAAKIYEEVERNYREGIADQSNFGDDQIASKRKANGIALVAKLIEAEKIEYASNGNGGFEVGDEVTWISQAGSYTKSKLGVVAEVVEKGRTPDRIRFPAFYKTGGIGSSRKHKSYVVLVNNKPYWPLVAKLKPSTKEST